jgi:hypothetical protein
MLGSDNAMLNFPLCIFGKGNIQANVRCQTDDVQNSEQNTIIEMEEFTCSVGLEAPHLRILQVERNAKLVFPQFGHTQSPSEKPSGPAQESPDHSFQITSSSSVGQMLL